MPLKLTITSYQRLSPGQETTKILDRGSISIGRAAQNDWVLQDPERILSSKHCTVHHQDGGYFLTDTSTNGVYLNDSDQRLIRNQKIRLKDGDHFVMGEYEIAATLLSAAESEESAPDGPITDVVPFPGLGAGDSILSDEKPSFAGGVADHDKPSFSDLLADDRESSHLPHAAQSRSERDKPSFSDLLADDRESSHLPHAAQPQSAGQVVTEPPPDASAPDRAFFEPPALIPETAPSPLELESPTPEPAQQAAEPVHPAPPPLEIPEWPVATPPVIPDIPAKPASEEAAIPDDWWLAPPAPALPPSTPATPPERPVDAPTPPPPVKADAVFEAPATPPPSVIAPAVPATPPLAAAPPVKSGDNDLVRAFLEGAGLPQARLADDRLPETLAHLGAIFRETVQGLAEILRARGDIKGEFRLDRTTIGPMENNPLKTPPGQPPLRTEEIMVLLLAPRHNAYMSPVQAVHEAFTDIKAHQVAVMAGIQAALNRLLERFDPGNLETRLQQTVFDSILPASRKAKYWDLFTSEYQAIAREAEDDFNELFGDEFARAYQERLRPR